MTISNPLPDDVSKIINKLENDLELFKDKKILITGGSGHLGYYVLLTMLEANRKLRLNSDITVIVHTNLNWRFNFYLDEFTQIEGDLTNLSFVEGLGQYEVIIHLAGYAQPSKFILDPYATIVVNTNSVKLLLQKLAYDGRFLYISSSEVYRFSELFDRDSFTNSIVDVDHPRSTYILSKLLGEKICEAELSTSSKKIIIARLSMTYGPGIKPGDTRAISSFFFQAISSGKIVLLDKGQAEREYLYVADAVIALFKILTKGKHSKYNIGGGPNTSLRIAQVAQIIGILTNSECKIPESNFNTIGAAEKVSLDISSYVEEFGEIGETDIYSGLSKTLDWLIQESSLEI